MTLQAALNLWLTKKGASWSFKVSEHVHRLARGWREVLGPETAVASIGAAEVERVELLRADGKRSHAALNQERSYMKAFFTYCRRLGWTDKEPMANWEWRKQKVRKAYATLSREEEARLLAVAPEWLRRFVVLAIYTGQREGTLRRVRWDMLRPVEGGAVLDIPGEVRKTRDDHRAFVPREVLESLGPPGEGEILLGLPNETKVWRAFKKYGRLAGINPKVTPHSLKATTVQRLTEAGYPIQAVMALVGNSSLTVLMQHYLRELSTKESEKAIRSMMCAPVNKNDRTESVRPF